MVDEHWNVSEYDFLNISIIPHRINVKEIL